MATDTSMQKVSFYSATVWKEIFDTLTKALEDRDEMSFTLVTHGPRNFVYESIGDDGKIDSKKLFNNIGGFYECDSLLKDEVVNPFIREKVSFAAVDRLDPGENGKTKTVCCFAIDSHDMERANEVIDRVNRNVQRANELSREELLQYCSDRQINLCGTSRIEKEIHDVLIAENKLDFPHAFIQNPDGSYDLRLPAQYEDDIANAGKIRSMIHSSRRLLVSSTINRDSDAGMAAQEAIDVGSPTGRIMFQNILHNGGIQFTKDTPFSLNTFAAAYAAANRLTMEEATERVKAFTLSGAFKGLDNPSMYQMDQAIAKSEHVAQYLKSNGPLQFNDMIRRLSDAGFREFIQNADLSDRLKEALINYNRAQLSNPDVIAGLLKNHTLPNDAEFLKTLHAADMNNRFGKGSFSGLIQRYILQIFKRMARDADAGRAWMEIYYSSRYLYSAYSSMVKLTMKVLGKFGITDPARLSGMIVDPLGTMRRAAQKKAVGLVAKTKPVKAVSRFGASAAKSLRKRVRTRIMKSGTVQVARRIKNLKAVAKITNLAGKLSKTVAHVAVKLGTLLGWIAVIVIVIALLLEIIQSQIKEEESTGMSNYITAQDTDIVQEIVAELTAKNQKFIADINDAANHRGSYASSVGVTANENVSYYDSYSIVFRDAYGNELDGTHVDLNNTKAIIAMASKFMPYAFQEPGENASEAKKLAYESIKQHFKDYCNFLWASTHQITIEEYHPGDSKYSNYDTSGLETTLDKGKCDQDGTTIWLPADFNPNKITHRGTEQVCSTCSPLPNTRYGEMGYALCGHAKESAEIEGWSKTGATREARNCYGDDCHHFGCDHSDGDYNCTSCEYESLEHVKKYHRSHWHTEYEWKYECGGHMGNVVYVTIGDLSRFPGMPAAEDVDYDAVAVYPSEYGTSTPESTGSTESSEAETGASE